jgi:hypothetical protein
MAPAAKAPVFDATPSYLSKTFFRFGDQLITLEKYGREDERPYVLVGLHGDEAAANYSAFLFARSHGAAFFRLQNDKKNVEADLLDRKVRFDPGNIFTSLGRQVNLRLNKCWSKFTNQRVQELASFLVGQVVRDKTVIAVHNDHNESVGDYQEGGRLAKQVKEVYVQPSSDAHDFFLTTDENIFNKLKDRDFNIILQKKGKMKDDGSLGVYCAKAGKSFVSVETLSAHSGMQQKMLSAIDAVLQ